MDTNAQETQKENVERHFSATALGYKQLYEDPRRNCYNIGYRARKQILLKSADTAPSEKARLLDVGCGPGVLSRELLDLGWNVDGLDASEKMIFLARDRVKDHRRHEQIAFRTGDVESLSFADDTFEMIIASGLIEYLEEPERALAEFDRVLKPGGLLLLTVPAKRLTYNHFLTFLRPLLRLIGRRGGALPYFHREWRPRELDRWLTKNGWRVIERHHYHFLFFPLDHLLPRLCMRIALFLDEKWEQSRLFGWLGKGYVVKAVKT